MERKRKRIRRRDLEGPRRRALRRGRSWARLAGFGALVIALMMLTGPVLALVSDTGTYDITVPNKSQSAGPLTLTPSGGNVEYIGSSANNQASGTGIFDPFVRLQGSPTEKGYNTDGTIQFDTKAGTWTHAIKVNAIPVVDCDGSGPGTATCWELFNDINESNTAKRISLNVVEVWFTTDPNITGYVDPTGFPSGATKEYEFNGDILINDVNQGSGRGDLRYLIPTAGHTWDSSTYFVLYSKWGTTPGTVQGNFGTGGWTSDGGFEEWKVRKTPNLSIVKTADASSVNAGSDIGFTITVTNTGVADATGVTISDSLPGGTGPSPVHWVESPDNPDCSISGSDGSQSLSCGPVTLAADGGSLSVHVSASTTQDNCGQYDNTATFTSTNAGSGSASASITVNCAAIVIHKDSTKGGPVANAGAVFSYDGSSVTDNGTGDEDPAVGSVCVGGLAPGTYNVNETTPPPGYGAAGETDLSVDAVQGTNCSTNLPSGTGVVTFTNAPLGEIEVQFRDLGSGETNASIVCTGLTPVSENSDPDPANDDTDEVYTNLPPGTYDCQVVIDP
jgi:uncharacterized repeat protein (TIGR01451 family)